MKIQNEKRLVETDGFENQAHKFTIKQNARAYEILSSNIYSDKILAVVREYGTNALDAHITVGKGDVPFEVHLPNTFEPYFHIRDFGPGLSDDDVYAVYTQYFNSTKDNDNDVTGCLGLGSKSAFAYTDQFTITSRHKGMKRTYTAYTSEDGSPAITKLLEVATDEEDGLEIHLPVKSEDFSTFVERAKTIYHRFPVLPTITGNKFDLTQIEYLLVGPNYKVRKSNKTRNQYSYRQEAEVCYAVQGSVAYPIELKELPTLAKDSPLRHILTAPIDIVFPIGELNITASRERLNYDKTTQANIIAALQSVYDHVPVHVKGVLAQAKTLWEAKLLYNKWTHDDGYGGYLKEIVQNKLEWNGQKLDSGVLKLKMFDLIPQVDPITNLPVMSKVDKDPKTGLFLQAQIKHPWGYAFSFGRDSLTTDRYGPGKSYETSVHVDDKTIIVFEDVRLKAPNQTIRHNFHGHPTRPTASTVVLIKCDAAKLADVKKQLGDAPIVMASTLEDPPKTPTATRASVKRKMQVVKSFRNWGAHDVEDTDIEISDGGIYLMAYDGIFLKAGGEQDPSASNQARHSSGFLHEMEKMGYFKDWTICKVNSTYKGGLTKDPTWITVWDKLTPIMNKLTDDVSNKAKLEAVIFLGELSRSNENDILNVYEDCIKKNIMSHLKDNSYFTKTIEKLKAYKALAESVVGLEDKDDLKFVASKCKDYITLTAHGAIDGMKIKSIEELPIYLKVEQERNKFFTTFWQKYPCALKMFDRYDPSNSYASQFNAANVIHYLQLCDGRRSLPNTTKGN